MNFFCSFLNQGKIFLAVVFQKKKKENVLYSPLCQAQEKYDRIGYIFPVLYVEKWPSRGQMPLALWYTTF